MPFYEMAIIDKCESYRNFSHLPMRDFSVVENLIKHCDLYKKVYTSVGKQSISTLMFQYKEVT